MRIEAADTSDESIIQQRLAFDNPLAQGEIETSVLRLTNTDGIHYVSAARFAWAPFEALDLKSLRLEVFVELGSVTVEHLA